MAGRGGEELLRHAVLLAHPGHRVWERAGVSGCVKGTFPPDHNQLPGGQPGCGRPARGIAGHAMGCVLGGKEIKN